MNRNTGKNPAGCFSSEEKGIAYVTLNRPEVLNTINREMLQRLGHFLDFMKTDDAVRAVIITGAGEKAFSAGADIVFFSTASPLKYESVRSLP